MFQKDFLVTADLEARAGVTRETIYGWLRDGLLPKPRTTGGRGSLSKWSLVAGTIVDEIQEMRRHGLGRSEIREVLVAKYDGLAEPKIRTPKEPKAPKAPTPASLKADRAEERARQAAERAEHAVEQAKRLAEVARRARLVADQEG